VDLSGLAETISDLYQGDLMHTITIRSQKAMALIPLAEYESLKETVLLLSQHPKLAVELKKIRRQMDQGQAISLEDFKKKHKVR
jgi:PHD/YefM family antitoxin component YafN of YafNO toxin-antitoxin module